MIIKDLSNNLLKILIHKHMSQAIALRDIGKKEEADNHDKMAKLASKELESRNKLF